MATATCCKVELSELKLSVFDADERESSNFCILYAPGFRREATTVTFALRLAAADNLLFALLSIR